jgi:hypothetical protein
LVIIAVVLYTDMRTCTLSTHSPLRTLPIDRLETNLAWSFGITLGMMIYGGQYFIKKIQNNNTKQPHKTKNTIYSETTSEVLNNLITGVVLDLLVGSLASDWWCDTPSSAYTCVSWSVVRNLRKVKLRDGAFILCNSPNGAFFISADDSFKTGYWPSSSHKAALVPHTLPPWFLTHCHLGSSHTAALVPHTLPPWFLTHCRLGSSHTAALAAILFT